MFDIHTHILPGIDDGSSSVEESIQMLSLLNSQNVTGIAATPHFYAQISSPDSFFDERQAAWEQLKPHLPSDTPEIRLGAEIQYFEGISRFNRLREFCISGTDLLLLEMPMCKWTSRIVTSVIEVSGYYDISVVLAHVERYLQYNNENAIDRLLQQGVFTQVSTGFFSSRPGMAVKMLKQDKIHFLGSDSHNMNSRKPDFDSALAVINQRDGDHWLSVLEQREAVMLY